MIKYIMIHHTAVSTTKNRDQFKANNSYHKSQWNFKSSLGYYLGYNYEISYRGRVRQARKDGETTAAAYQSDMNDGRCIHIALDGNFDIEKPQPAQIFALRDLIKRLVKEYNITQDNIVFHRDYANKSCPGENMDINFIRSIAFPEVIKQKEKSNNNKEVIKLLKKAISLIN